MNITGFENVINDLENEEYSSDYILKKGTIPILFTAPHTMEQFKEDGTVKHAELFTKAIALYLNKFFGVSALVKLNDTGIDSNRFNNDEFKDELISFV